MDPRDTSKSKYNKKTKGHESVRMDGWYGEEGSDDEVQPYYNPEIESDNSGEFGNKNSDEFSDEDQDRNYMAIEQPRRNNHRSKRMDLQNEGFDGEEDMVYYG